MTEKQPRPMRNVVTELLSRSRGLEEEARHHYREVATASLAIWAMIDLRASASFRLAAGDENSFARAQALFKTVGVLVEIFPSVEVFKELGDGVLLRATDFRDLVEMIVLLDAVNQYWQVDAAADPRYGSLDHRVAVTSGESVGIGGDYFGSPIDRVARLSSIACESEDGIAVIDSEVAKGVGQRLEDYPFLALSSSRPVPPNLVKAGEPAGRIVELLIDRPAFGGFRDRFAKVRGFLPLPE